MTKLQGVKVIEATGGEITKVAYAGAEYKLDANADYKANKGDLVRINEDYDRQIINGEFYEVVGIDYDGDALYRDEEGDERCAYVFDVYRKIEEASELTTKFNVGDVVVTLEKCGWAKDGQGLMLAGAVGKVKAVEGDLLTVKFDKKQPKGAYTKKADRKNFVVKTSEVRLATAEEAATIAKKKKAEVIEFEGEQYRKVDRKAQAGDVVIFRKNTSSTVENGKPYKVTPANANSGGNLTISNGYPNLYHGHYGRTPETVDVYEKVEAKYVPQEGDIVVVTANNTGSANNVGDIGKVGAEKPLVDGGVCVYVPNGPTRCVRTWPSDIRKATPAEVEAYEKALADVSKPKYAVGNIVKLVKSDRGNAGEYAEIIEVGTFKASTPRGIEDTTYLIRMLTGKDKCAVFAGRDEYYEKATQADVDKTLAPKLKAGDFVKFEEPDLYDITVGKIYEVITDDNGNLCIIDDAGDEDYSYLAEFAIKVDAEEAAKQRESAKWAKIGRAKDEYKVGDVIEITEYQNGDPVGTITKVLRVHGRGAVTYKSVSNGTYLGDFDAIKLVATVESTLN